MSKQGQIILVDDDDYERIKDIKVKIYNGIPSIQISGKTITLHKHILNDDAKDTKYQFNDGNALNLQKENISLYNKRKQASYKPFGSSKYKGVSTRKDMPGIYECRINRGGKVTRIGIYVNVIAAANAYNYYAKLYHGEYAYINDVPYMSLEECNTYLKKYHPSTSIKKTKPKKPIKEIHCKLCNCLIPPESKKSRENQQCIKCTSTIKKKKTEEKNNTLKLKKEMAKKAKMDELNNLLSSGYKECYKCEKIKTLDNFTKVHLPKAKGLCKDCVKDNSAKWYKENKDRSLRSQKKWKSENRPRLREYGSIRKKNNRTRDRYLRSDLTSTQWKSILRLFNYKCALTNSEDIHAEHFIPLAWNHGGTYKGNIYPLDGMLNINKKDENPFEWIKRQDNIDQDKWNYLINYLSKLNGLSPSEFKEYIYWCENNKRTLEEVINDSNKTSVQLYKESLSFLAL